MKYNRFKSFLPMVMAVALLTTTGCRDEFSEINTNPSSISQPNVPYLFSQGVLSFEPSNYLFWFYNGKYQELATQASTTTSGYTTNFNFIGAMGDQGSQVINVLRYAREIDDAMLHMPAEDAAKYVQLRAMLNPLIVYLGLFDSDVYGDRPFSEACYGAFGGTLSPKYDTVQELYTQFLAMLNESLAAFASPGASQVLPANQDPIYKCDITKWAKLTNSLKLKIAVRLLHQDKAKALSLAAEVAQSSVGVLDGADTDFMFNKGILNYHFGEGAQWGAVTQRVTDFMLKNLDPRVRFFFTKNSFNSKVVQGFFDEEAKGTALTKLPAYILANVNYKEEGGKKVFVSWKGAGEPWVRYYGLPTPFNAKDNAATYGDYFDANRWKLTEGNVEKSFRPYSTFNEEMVRGQIDFTIPTVPGDAVIQDLNDNAWYGLYMSTAEVNLYLAEFKLLGASLPKSAAEYYETAVKASVREYDRLAGINKIPYYGTTYGYDPNEKVINLQEGEVDVMMAKADYQLTGSAAEQLEKVYIQQFLHFVMAPTDQFVTVRRSGVPKKGSALIAWEPTIDNTTIARRMDVNPPSPTSIMYDNTMAAYNSQGFTPGSGNNPEKLNAERLWQDKGAPNYGEGPNF